MRQTYWSTHATGVSKATSAKPYLSIAFGLSQVLNLFQTTLQFNSREL